MFKISRSSSICLNSIHFPWILRQISKQLEEVMNIFTDAKKYECKQNSHVQCNTERTKRSSTEESKSLVSALTRGLAGLIRTPLDISRVDYRFMVEWHIEQSSTLKTRPCSPDKQTWHSSAESSSSNPQSIQALQDKIGEVSARGQMSGWLARALILPHF